MADLCTILEALSLHDSRIPSHSSINHAQDFHKSRIVSRHDLVYGSVQQTMISARLPIVQAQRPSPPLAQLTSITLLQMDLDRTYNGSVLHGTLCVDAFHVSTTVTCLEVQPGMAVRLYIPLFTSSLSHVQSLFPKGARIAIKEPCMRRCSDGIVAIEIHNPSAIQRLDQCIDDGDQRVHNKLFTEGNRRLEEQDWEGAIDSYTRCIQMIIHKGSIANSTFEAFPEDKQSELLAYSSRAETWIRLKNFEQALRDSIRALEIDPNHVQGLFLRGRAFHGLNRYNQASASFQKALEKDPKNKELEDALQDSNRCYTLVTGNFDHVTDFLISGIANMAAEVPKCCQYTGSVEVRMTSDGRGRGLFACRDVKAGELLLVSPPFLLCPQAPIAEKTLAAQAQALTSASQELSTALFAFAKFSSITQFKLRYLQSDSYNSNLIVPPMEMFQYGVEASADDCSEEDVDMSSISGIVRLNSFTEKNIVEANPRPWFAGIWLLPSFINHSCIQNATYMYIGHAMFIHAAADIEDGEEITISYVDSLLPLSLREGKLKTLGFTCKCKRCLLERFLSNPLETISSEYAAVHEKAVKEAISAVEAGEIYPTTLPECAVLARLTLKLEKVVEALTPLQQNWIRASYATAYIAGMIAYDFLSALSAERIVEAMASASPGHPRTFSFIQWQLVQGLFDEEKAMEACICTYGKWKPDAPKRLVYSGYGASNLFRNALHSCKLD